MNRYLLIVLSLTALSACSSGGTKFVGTWANPEYKSATLDNVVVIAVAENQVSRGMFESTLVGHLQDSGVTAYQSITLLPTEEMLTKEQVGAVIREKGIKAVIVTRLVDIQEKEEYVPPSTTVYGGYPSYGYPYYGSYYGYYSHSYEVVHNPGYTYTNVTVTLEIDIDTTGGYVDIGVAVSSGVGVSAGRELSTAYGKN